jgi:hypothetical protein
LHVGLSPLTGTDAVSGEGDWSREIGTRPHPVNAMLNYGYAVLESEVRIAILQAGLDPEIGYLHANRKGRLSLVYDLMEPMRPVVDRAVLGFVNDHAFAPTDFTLSERGNCRLHPQLARRIVEVFPRAGDLARPVSQLLAVGACDPDVAPVEHDAVGVLAHGHGMDHLRRGRVGDLARGAALLVGDPDMAAVERDFVGCAAYCDRADKPAAGGIDLAHGAT